MAATFRQFITALAGRRENPDSHVHFHRGPSGHPAVCDDPRCDQPRLAV